MATFKQVPQSFLVNALLNYWGNMVKNYQGSINDNDFFEIVQNGYHHDRAVELIEATLTPSELKNLTEIRSRRSRLDLDDSLQDIFQVLWNNEKFRQKSRDMLLFIKDSLLEEIEKAKSDTLKLRFRELKRIFKLNELEYEVLLFAFVRKQTCFCWPIRIEDREKPLYYAMALNRSYAEVLSVMNGNSRLRKMGLLDSEWDVDRMLSGYIDGVTADPIRRRFYQKNEEDALPWDFYGELSARHGEILKRMLGSKPTKCNILLYGAPGTGKTSFARSLARELGRTAWEVRQGEVDGQNMKVESRIVGIQLCSTQELPDESLMIVDEADELLRSGLSFNDMFTSGGGKSTEKGVVNTLLDEMQVPTVWIANAPASRMDESVRRRFDYSICFEELNNAQRVSIWRNIVKKQELGGLISEEQVADYAMKYATSAGGISNVLANVKRMNPGKDQVDEVIAKLMKPHCELMRVKDANCFLPAKGYSLDGLNVKGKVTPAKIVKAVKNYMDADFNEKSEDKPRMNVLLFGPPGTGKTEFVKYLGKELDRKVIVVKGSDLLSKWVGESEQNIAAAFRRAERERAVLFFDEIDGLVQNREKAHGSWEVTQVNELLQQMENFNGVMIAATNFCKNLDPAIMRRFTFKLEFDYLDDAGKRSFFERMFKVSLTDGEMDELGRIRNLAPGDFRTVRQETFYLDEEQSNAELIAALKEECLVKKDGEKTAKIGFAA